MAQLLNEEYNINVEEYTKKDGTKGRVAYIDPQTSEDVYPIKDEIKNKFKARWDNQKRRWFWYLSMDDAKNQWILDTYIYPCVDYLVSVEDQGQGKRTADDVKAKIDPILKGIEKVLASPSTSINTDDVKAKLAAFKEDLVNIMSSDEFKAKMEPIIKFRQAQGHQFSFLNSILVFIQDPKATLVKSKSKWAKFNRTINKDAKPIALWVPYGGIPLTDDQKNIITRRFCDKCKVPSVKELNQGQKEQLDILLKPRQAQGFSLRACFYDVRFTTQMEGKKDLAGDPKALDSLEWFENGEETPQTIKLADAILKTIQESKVKLTYETEKELGKARGVSKSGTIAVLKDAPKNAGFVNTLVHEFAHECLHQRYLSNSKDGSEWASFFLGKDGGRAQVEQQAELTAWIVLKFFGIDLQTSYNYMGCWGMDKKNASKVFDTVANVANSIYTSMRRNMEGIQEAKMLNEQISGKDIADMLGLGKLYDKSKMMDDTSKFDEAIHEAITKTWHKFLKEQVFEK